ncbi:uncharacterized protein ACBT57_019492 isoform 1-T1 [Dama dama]
MRMFDTSSKFPALREYIMRNAGLDEAQAGTKIAGRNINNLRNQSTICSQLDPADLGAACHQKSEPSTDRLLCAPLPRPNPLFVQGLFLAAPHSTPNFPYQGLNLRPQQWKCGVLTTGLLGKSK